MKTKHALTITFIMTMAASLVADSAKRANFKYMKSIKEPASDGSADVFRIELDSDVYDNTARSLSDVRLFREDGSDVPYQRRRLTERKTTTRTVSWPGKVVTLKKLPENRLELLVRNPKDDAPTAFTFATPMRNYEKDVRVSYGASFDDLKEFNGPRRIYDYTGIVRGLKDNEIPLPKTKAPCYSLIFDDFKDSEVSPFRRLVLKSSDGDQIEKLNVRDRWLTFDSITFIKRTEVDHDAQDVKRTYPLAIIDTEEKDDETVVTLESKREPLTSIEISTKTANFARDVTLKTSDDRKNWRVIANGTLFNVNASSVKKSHLTLPFPEGRREYYQLIIKNGDNPPITVEKASAKGAVDTVEFLPNGLTAPPALYYGGSVPFPKYDVAQVIDKMNKPRIATMDLGEQESNPLYDPSKRKSDGFLNSKTTFVAAIVIMVAVLALVLFKSAGKLPETTENHEKPE